MSKSENIIVEVLRPDGTTSLWVGELVKRTKQGITLVDATWIAATGRRHKFLAGVYDENTEWEPHPDGEEITIEAPVLWLGPWKYGLLRNAR